MIQALILTAAIFERPGLASDRPVREEILLSTHGDDISFDRVDIVGSTRRPLALTFTNQASQGSGISHNVVILKPGSEDAVFARLYEVNFDLTQMTDHHLIVALGKPLSPGQSETLVVKFNEPGVYPFVCLMPGHGDMMGMKGKITVR